MFKCYSPSDKMHIVNKVWCYILNKNINAYGYDKETYLSFVMILRARLESRVFRCRFFIKYRLVQPKYKITPLLTIQIGKVLSLLFAFAIYITIYIYIYIYI